ncbi:demethylmenaquinone methyltransferase-like [Patiria miniata]|uniref:Methyltransferase domain-containing protein n=1 Tax=Patiria miniata TaxID=46514 RepID=A0A914BME4_PATMI|nr:demethylmenaquinone methyltransferase-like [Patiria miniata]
MALSNHNAEEVADETAEDFSSRVVRQITGGLACLGIAMGVETGLFDVLISLGGDPKTSQEIADIADLKERYVREWLGCMAASDIVTFEPAQERYWLPAHRMGILQSSMLSMAIPCLAGGFFEVAECFKKNGPAGVEYDKYPKLDEVLDKLHQPFFRDQFLQEFIPSMPKLLQQLKRGIQVLEVGCCEGDSLRMLASCFPKTAVYGLDISPTVIKQARVKTKELGLTNLEFVCEDVCAMPADWTWKFDYIFIYFVLHDLSYPDTGLREMYRVLKPGGTLSVVDTVTHTKLQDNIADEDKGYVLTQFTMSLMNCLPVSSHPGDGAGLGAMWGREKAREMLEDANFEVLSISATNAELNGLHYLCSKPICENNNMRSNGTNGI